MFGGKGQDLPIYELAALGAAICWAVTGLMSTPAVAHLGPFGFNLYRQGTVTVVLLVIVLISGQWQGVTPAQAGTLAVSGVVGIFLGDTMLFVTLTRLGPRRTGALFALNAPMAAVLGWAVLGEELSKLGWMGVFLCAAGVGIAVLGRPGRSGTHKFEAVSGNVWIGIGFGLLAALGQAMGSLIARPVMETGFDPFTGSLIRVAVAVICLALLSSLPIPRVKPRAPLNMRVFLLLAGSGIIAMVVGMSLLLFALQGGKVGIVSTLSALSPVFILPVLWIVTGARPSAASWFGAAIATLGMAMIFLR
ncbi:DMT family transporter [Paracoccus sp. SCSIO 75233]|uniref:DMT family transporter n=1 Tax=Paracoccus sp. SCSIO 75233 TaxID=3017782 RepID=UPI0022EFE928|nr:DMT family transporter [Paracoccus sp. SCSIO 75233]WBU54593.1 DMT family transporter [Paracoccus sp. SCSIO 75233]